MSLFDQLHDRYSNSSHVGVTGITGFLQRAGYPDDEANEVAAVLLALYGGPKGTRTFRYFVYLTHMENPVEDVDEPVKDYVTQECQTLIEEPACFPEMCPTNERAAVI